jgi:hypothetical protein
MLYVAPATKLTLILIIIKLLAFDYMHWETSISFCLELSYTFSSDTQIISLNNLC